MRIYGNRQLKTVPGQTTRPTSAKVREAIFNIWQGEIADCSWLDLCAGNGSMGAEALCRDAKKVVGIEKYGKACSVIRQNWQQIAKPEQTWQIIQGDVLTKIKTLAGQQFDRIYFDPPYDSYLYLPVLKAIASLELLAPAGELAVEHDSQIWQAKEIPGLELYRTKSYGKTTVTFYFTIPRRKRMAIVRKREEGIITNTSNFFLQTSKKMSHREQFNLFGNVASSFVLFAID